MKIIYLLQCHKSFEQIKLLLESLELSREDFVIIHVDAKNINLRHRISSYYFDSDNVFVVNDPVVVNWSGFSQIKATLKMIGYVYRKKINFDYCCLLSGEDIVLDVFRFKKYLSLSGQKSFLEFRDDRERYTWRINRFNLFRDNRFSRKYLLRLISFLLINIQLKGNIRRSNFIDDDIFLGSQWFVFSKRHLDLIYNLVDDNYINKFRYTSCCDEHFFQMFFKKFVHQEEYETYNLRYAHFPTGKNSPKYLTLLDLKNIKGKDKVFIARKVSYDVLYDYMKNKGSGG